MVKFYRFQWSQHDEDLELDAGKGVYYITAGVPYNVADMKNIVSRSRNISSDHLTIDSVTEISREEYESVTKQPFVLA